MTAAYVYGLARTPEAGEGVELPTGVGGQPVRRLSAGGLDALVSTIEAEVGLDRDDVAAHGRVLDAALAAGTVAPMNFATVLDDDDAVRRVLGATHEDITALLARLDGHVEVSVRGYLREEAAIEAAVGDDPGVRRLQGRQRSLQDRIRLGEAVARAVEARATAAGSEIVDTLATASTGVVVGPLRSEQMALNASFLVSGDRMAAFDRRLTALGGRFATWLELHVVSPLPPYSFSDLVLTGAA
ncbi:MAG TPA: GvpL/GvpF family gas vesicle protein [Acidimicrobiales bacterium]|nr:GvpL/GvpF family gas vesicle protein [Acidimicrobiales bacterium]